MRCSGICSRGRAAGGAASAFAAPSKRRRERCLLSLRGNCRRRLDLDAGAVPAGSAFRAGHLAGFGLAGASNALASGKKQAALLSRIAAFVRASPRARLGRSCGTEPRLGGQILACFIFAHIYSD